MNTQLERKMQRYLMDKHDLLRLCGKTGKTRILITFDNDSGEGTMEVATEDAELLFSKGVEELRERYGEKLSP